MAFFDPNPVKLLLNIFCALLLYVMFYIVYVIFSKIRRYLMFWKSNNSVSKPFYFVLDFALYYVFLVVLFFIPAIGVIFIMLFLIWKAIWAIGFGTFLNGVTPFHECYEIGLFTLFQKTIDIIGGNDAFDQRLRAVIIASKDFFTKVLKEAFGIVYEGYTLDDEYLSNALNVLILNKLYNEDKEKCEAANKQFLEVTKHKTPMIKINFVDKLPDQTVCKIDNSELSNCIKQNTVDIPDDANTIEKLKLIFSNTIAKQKCIFDLQTNSCTGIPKELSCAVADLEKAARTIGEALSSGSVDGIVNSATFFSDQYTTAIDGMSKNKS